MIYRRVTIFRIDWIFWKRDLGGLRPPTIVENRGAAIAGISELARWFSDFDGAARGSSIYVPLNSDEEVLAKTRTLNRMWHSSRPRKYDRFVNYYSRPPLRRDECEKRMSRLCGTATYLAHSAPCVGFSKNLYTFFEFLGWLHWLVLKELRES